MPILDSDFDDGANNIDEQRKCPYCNGLLCLSKKPSILYECIGCGYEEPQWEKHKTGYKDGVNMLAKPKPTVVLHKKAKPTTNTSKEQEKSVFVSNEQSVAKNEEQMKMERTLKDCCISIFEAVSNIENGKYVMPAFQRQYVWNMEQIEKLWDSILLDYPISTFLFWHIDEQNITSDT